MMDSVINIVSGISLGLGAFLLISGSIGLLRFPDFYTRMHAAGVTDTLAAALIIFGLMLIAGWGLTLIKLVLILLFVLLTAPTASHALAKAAQHAGLEPFVKDDSGKE
jgi:multicomponent Na+:H+ antiporter subunit G